MQQILTFADPNIEVFRGKTFTVLMFKTLKQCHYTKLIYINKYSRKIFSRIPHLWNALPPIDLSQSVATNKAKIIRFLYGHVLSPTSDQITPALSN